MTERPAFLIGAYRGDHVVAAILGGVLLRLAGRGAEIDPNQIILLLTKLTEISPGQL